MVNQNQSSRPAREVRRTPAVTERNRTGDIDEPKRIQPADNMNEKAIVGQ